MKKAMCAIMLAACLLAPAWAQGESDNGKTGNTGKAGPSMQSIGSCKAEAMQNHDSPEYKKLEAEAETIEEGETDEEKIADYEARLKGEYDAAFELAVHHTRHPLHTH